MFKSPAMAMIWELWRTSRLATVWVLCGQLAWVLAIASLKYFNHKLDGEEVSPVLCGIFMMTTTITSGFSQSWRHSFESRRAGFCFHLGYARPVPTWQLVLIPMLFMSIMTAVCYWVAAVSLQALTGIQVPLIFPALLSICIVSGLACAAWTPTCNASKLVAIASFVVLLVGSLAAFHQTRGATEPLLYAIGKPEYFHLQWYEYLPWAAAPAIATAVTISGVRKQRQGEQWRLEAFASSVFTWHKRQHSSELAQTTFRSAWSAQCWYEFQRFGHRMLVFGFVAPLLPLTLVILVSLLNPSWDREPLIWLAFVAFLPIATQMIGADGALGLRAKQGAISFSVFDATRSLRNDQLIAVKLLLISACALAAWLWMATIAGLHAWLSGQGPLWGEVLGRVQESVAAKDLPSYWWLAVGLSFAFLYVASTSMMLAGSLWASLHHRIPAILTAIFMIHYLLAVWDMSHAWRLRALWVSYAWIGSGAISILAGLCIIRARQSGMLSRGYFRAIVALWLVYVVTVATWMVDLKAQPGWLLALTASSLLIPLATSATAPLALAGHRHR